MKCSAAVACLTVSALAAPFVPLLPIQFHDVAAASGLTARNVYGGLHRKDYILETATISSSPMARG
jgi:hypothetical protein